MGFLKKFFIYFLLLITACSTSLIKVNVKLPQTTHPIFGASGNRNFYYSISLSDSLKFLWQASTYGGFNNSSVVVYDSLLFVGELSGRVYCFNINTGKQLGVIKTKGAIFSTPLVTNFRLYFPLVKSESRKTEVIAYDFYAGKEVFIVEIEDRITNQILFDSDAIYLTAADGTIYKYNLEMKLIWTAETNQNISCVPALFGEFIFIGNEVGEVLKIDKSFGRIIKRQKISSRFVSGISVDDEKLFIGDDDGNLFSINSENLNVNFKIQTGSRILMNPVIDLENVFIGNLKGDLFSINKHNGKINWSKNYKGLFNSTPIVSQNKIIIPDAFKAYWILDKNDGSVIKKLELDGRAKLSPVLIDKKLFIGYDDGILEAYEFN